MLLSDEQVVALLQDERKRARCCETGRQVLYACIERFKPCVCGVTTWVQGTPGMGFWGYNPDGKAQGTGLRDAKFCPACGCPLAKPEEVPHADE